MGVVLDDYLDAQGFTIGAILQIHRASVLAAGSESPFVWFLVDRGVAFTEAGCMWRAFVLGQKLASLNIEYPVSSLE